MNAHQQQATDLMVCLSKLNQLTHGTFVAFIDGIPKDVWDADKYPYLNANNPEEKKRLNNLIITITFLCLCLQEIHWKESLRLEIEHRARELLRSEESQNLNTCMVILIDLPQKIASDVPTLQQETIKAIVEFNLLKQEVIAILDNRIKQLDVLIAQIDKIIDGNNEKIAKVHASAMQVLIDEKAGIIKNIFKDVNYELNKEDFYRFIEGKIDAAIKCKEYIPNQESSHKLRELIEKASGEFFDKKVKHPLEALITSLTKEQSEAAKETFVAHPEVRQMQTDAFENLDKVKDHTKVKEEVQKNAKNTEVRDEAETKKAIYEAGLKQVKSTESHSPNASDGDALSQMLQAKESLTAIKEQLSLNKDDFDDFINIAKNKIASPEPKEQAPCNTKDIMQKMQQTNGQKEHLNDEHKQPKQDNPVVANSTPSSSSSLTSPKKDDGPDKQDDSEAHTNPRLRH